jgi:branched-chain amino acid transport system permease protein
MVLEPSPYLLTVLQTGALLAIAALGLNVAFGYAGDLSLGQAGFYALGAYTSTLIGNRFGISFWVAAVIGATAAAAVAPVIGAIAIRARGLYLAMITVAFGLIVAAIATEWVDVTGGPSGLYLSSRPDIAGARLSVPIYTAIILAALVIAYRLTANLLEGQWGRRWKAVKASAVAAESIGIGAFGSRVIAFAIAGACAGIAGALLPPQSGFISSEYFTMDWSLLVVIAVLLGGAGSRLGPLIGAAIVTAISLYGITLGYAASVIYGGILIALIYVAPDGLAGLVGQRLNSWHVHQRSPSIVPAIERSPLAGIHRPVRAESEILMVEGVSKRFGGVRALADAGLQVRQGEIHGLIGSNGSGKTTLVNIVTGVIKPDTGTVQFLGHQLAGLRPHQIAGLGITRTFQSSEIFQNLSVAENVSIAVPSPAPLDFFQGMIGLGAARKRADQHHARALEMLSLVGLELLAAAPTGALSPGQRRLLEVARALAGNPRLVVLDEPAAGLNDAEVVRLADVLHVVKDAGIAVLIVEHRMELIMQIADRVTVLGNGLKIAEGTPAEIRANPEVIEAYLGQVRS